MSHPLSIIENSPLVIPPEAMPNYDLLVTEDNAAVDGMYSEKQMRLLTEPLYSSWSGPGPGRSFWALANVGLFYSINAPAIVPDVMLSADVQAPQNIHIKESRSYFIWLYQKTPDVAIEIVSNKEGGEDDTKLALYAQIGVPYYVIWDLDNLLKGGKLRVFDLHVRSYQPKQDLWFPLVNLGLTTWHGQYEDLTTDWLRWCDRDGNVIPTGKERATIADQEAETARQEAKVAKKQAKAAKEEARKAEARSKLLEEKLRSLGIDPNGNAP